MAPKEISGYRVVRRLGAGGMGEVFLVDHPRLPRQDALKLLGPQFGGDPQFAARFLREADILAGLRHPNIVTIYDRGEYEDRLWLAMEYVAGEDAAQYLRTRGPLPAQTVAQIVEQVGSALDWAWSERRLTHRDIKPGNILLEPARSGGAPVVKLVDFGIAKASDEASSLTATGVAVGTMAYLAPEVIEGKPLDNRADEYSLACTAFELLTGAPPFGPGTPSSVVMAHLQAPVPDPATRAAGVPRGLAQVFARAMAKQPQDRFPDNAEFARAFRAALGTAPAGPPVVGSTSPNRPPVQAAEPTLIRPTPPPTPIPAYATPPPATPPPAEPAGNAPQGNGRVIALAALVAVLVVALAAVGYLAFGRGDSAPPAVSTTAAGTAGPTVPTTPITTTATAPTTGTTTVPTVPGTDAYGFVGSPARCAGGEQLDLALLTTGSGAGSRVVICSSGGEYTYRGARASGDNSGVTLPAARSGAGAYRAVNRNPEGKSDNDFIYSVSASGLVISRGDGRAVASEPARAVWVR
ncbi:serine/threonine protein kinase [Tsukamurella sputi]|uniref:non-specific serine/threonine protein kinase n=1 Tax=Tsukamurella sputi TaxID=2591848 RepID=A0A5C5RQP4_9ACTN|nr:serine/threonine-protein kinase [Tsukamurella sputi]TWS24974.1 serine/threonine protein kinase [Tsukamurella sputi]